MLSAADNAFLSQVGPGTPMGNLFRRFWLPALMPSELPEPDCAPIRHRMLGEDLVAYRDSSGRVAFMQDACPHRGASMFFGRNEEDGTPRPIRATSSAGWCGSTWAQPTSSRPHRRHSIGAW